MFNNVWMVVGVLVWLVLLAAVWSWYWRVFNGPSGERYMRRAAQGPFAAFDDEYKEPPTSNSNPKA